MRRKSLKSLILPIPFDSPLYRMRLSKERHKSFLIIEFNVDVMDTWKVGERLTCDRVQRHALVTELHEMHSGIYATLYNPDNQLRLYGLVEMLQQHGWRRAEI